MNALRIILCAALIATAASACNRDTDVENVAANALEDAGLYTVAVDWNDDTKTIHLTGTVDNTEDRQKAEEVVESAAGTYGQVANEVVVNGAKAAPADQADLGIQEHLDSFRETDVMMKDRPISFTVENGVVTITGVVPNSAEKDHVGEIARNVPGVREVVNALEIRPSE